MGGGGVVYVRADPLELILRLDGCESSFDHLMGVVRSVTTKVEGGWQGKDLHADFPVVAG